MRFALGMVLSGAMLALATGCGKSGSTTAPAPGSNIEGTYVIVGMEIFGEKIPDAEVNKDPESERTIKITADQMISSKTKGKEEPASYKIDTSKTPMTIDVNPTKSSDKDEKMYGIVKLEGDTLTLCVTRSDKPEDRPKEFKSTKEEKTVMMTMQKK
jgi:uncharacterized protein (TIGR03067 family)